MPAKKLISKKLARKEELGARRALLEEIFNDFYENRRSIYLMNFIRGIFFGLGSMLGGTVVVAVVVYALSFFVNIPIIGESAERAQDSLQQAEQE